MKIQLKFIIIQFIYPEISGIPRAQRPWSVDSVVGDSSWSGVVNGHARLRHLEVQLYCKLYQVNKIYDYVLFFRISWRDHHADSM